MDPAGADRDHLEQLERAMWRPETRGDRAWMAEHLADDFVEFGRSGRRYERAEILDLPVGELDAELSGVEVRLLAADVALVTYQSSVRGRFAHRASMWRRTADRWRLVFHQGTPTAVQRAASADPDDAESFDAWDRRTAVTLERAYLTAGPGPGGSGSSAVSDGVWRAARQHLAVPMDHDGDWLDVGCANGHLLATLPAWAAERGVCVEPHGLELLPSIAGLARSLHPELADRIWTGSAMTWVPPRRFRYVTVLDDAVPPDRLGELVDRLLARFVEPNGRLIVSSYTDRGGVPRSLRADLVAAGHHPDGRIHIDRPGHHPLQTAWFDAR